MSRRGWRLGAGVLLATAVGSRAAAHDLPLDTVMNAFVKVEAREVHLLVRVPLDLLHSVPFPVNGPEYDLSAAGPATAQALRALAEGIRLWEGGARLLPSGSSARFALPSDRSFTSYRRAAAHVLEPVEPGTRIFYDQGFLDARFTYPIASPSAVFSLETAVAPDLGHLVKLSVRYLPLGGGGRAFLMTARSGRVPLNPTWFQAARSFVSLGVEHILSGVDHLLFLLCLVVPFRRMRAVIAVVTAFTLAHSITLVAAAYRLTPDGAWFPPLVEVAIAASIVYMALENIVGAELRRRWIATALFGLVHGLGFSQGLRDGLQFAGSHLLVSLFSFNLGIELGQVAVLAALLPLLALLRRLAPERAGVVVLSALVAHTGWHWMLERWQVLSQAEWPRPDAASLPLALPWVVGLAVAALGARLLARWAERRWRPRLPAVGTGERS